MCQEQRIRLDACCDKTHAISHGLYMQLFSFQVQDITLGQRFKSHDIVLPLDTSLVRLRTRFM